METQKTQLEWVYCLVERSSGEISYIGRAKNSYRCAMRIAAHSRKQWFKGKEWRVHFYPCMNRAESEAIETELINRYDPPYNKDKKGWGHFLEDVPDINEAFSIQENFYGSHHFIEVVLSDFEQKIVSLISKDGGINESDN